MMMSAPSASACWAAVRAPSGVPVSSFSRSWNFGLLNSAAAISAAFFNEVPAAPTLPAAVKGRISATRMPPGTAAGVSATGSGLAPNPLMPGILAPPVHPASSPATRPTPTILRVRPAPWIDRRVVTCNGTSAILLRAEPIAAESDIPDFPGYPIFATESKRAPSC